MKEKRKIVLLTGAGISEESGLGVFRGGKGLWDNFKLEEVATFAAWQNDPKLVLSFYNLRRKQNIAALPNAAHLALVDLEEVFEVRIITQNIDNLHERAGSKTVLHLHGEIMKGKTVEHPQQIFEVSETVSWGDVDPNGHQIRPHVVWFGEPVPLMEKAIEEVVAADIFIVIGTSLNVYPAASLVSFAPKDAVFYLVDPAPVDSHFPYAYTHIKSKASEGVVALVEKLLKA
ncbi:NAD-dependent deacylase [Putridiphycobacter roseus]|uniref:protein acetyllysine N-acetyltransferase n=1 Tax=Putridiphycobacter roseus TaxID=2219161 RepID=A0A2W1N2C8_9FLAO|nr:Sir2 family NAD-dependent protein deacetylase [Putridiphycobacter roseus]PZE18809.1 NAD-dependent deacylase [Putridiphycobacter roseus]